MDKYSFLYECVCAEMSADSLILSLTHSLSCGNHLIGTLGRHLLAKEGNGELCHFHGQVGRL